MDVPASARIGQNTVFGRHVVVGEGVLLGDDCVIGNNVVIHPGARLGTACQVNDNAVIGKLPLKAPRSATTTGREYPPTRIGDRCILGTGVVVYRGSTIADRVLIADQATIREEVTVGELTIIGKGATIENRCAIGRCCKIESEAYLTAFSTLEDFVFIAPGVVTTNDNFVGRTAERFKHFKGVLVRRGGRVGGGSVILPGRTIGEDALVAAGSVVTRDVPARKVVMGSPARVVRDVPDEQLLERQGWPEVTGK
jgi:acetyltransferase-like isoleucine patch superfamily enzyme